ncbi:MAG: M24 family metallopeptidase [Fidelibacterota bacterium]|jgi:Xaa-Pro dipeptidase
MLKNRRESLIGAELKAKQLFEAIIDQKLIQPDKSESGLSKEIYNLAFQMFGIKEYWHKRIVRTGVNTVHPYKENPENLIIKTDDILFFDFGPVFDQWEADFGRTYVIGDDPIKIKMVKDIEECWFLAKAHYDLNLTITGSELYRFVSELAIKRSWEFGNEHCGHLIGPFPHERIQGEKIKNYLHSDNHLQMREKDDFGEVRDWILEIHFIDNSLKIGGFYEQLL